jgi:hypothetical protein
MWKAKTETNKSIKRTQRGDGQLPSVTSSIGSLHNMKYEYAGFSGYCFNLLRVIITRIVNIISSTLSFLFLSALVLYTTCFSRCFSRALEVGTYPSAVTSPTVCVRKDCSSVVYGQAERFWQWKQNLHNYLKVVLLFFFFLLC